MIGVAGAAVLLLSIGLLCTRRIDTAMQLCALQGLFAAASLAVASPAMAIVAAALNGVALPLAIARRQDATPLTVRGSTVLSWTATLALLTVTGVVFVKVGADGLVASGVSVALLGTLLIAVRENVLAPVLGLWSAQNGLVMLAGAAPEPSLPLGLAVAVPLVPALVFAERWLRR